VLFASSVFLALGFMLHAKVKTFKSEERLHKYLRQSDVAVVMFYQKPDKPDDKSERAAYKEALQNIKDLQARFKVVSDEERYKEVDMMFLQGDVDREDVAAIAREYAVTTFPAFLLFKEGVVLRKNNNPLILTGDINRLQLNEFIDTHLGDKIDDILDEQERILKRRLEKAKIRAYNTPYWGYGYPYWGWGWGYPNYGGWYGWYW
jgi:thioredoxin-related protein